MGNDDHWVRDSLLESAADAQRGNGMLPTPVDNSQYIEGVLLRLDAKERDQVERPSSTKKTDAFQGEVEKRCERAGREAPSSYSVERNETKIRASEVSGNLEARGVLWNRLWERVRLIKSRPEWADKIKCVNPRAISGALGPHKRHEAELALWKVIAETDKKWGEWWKPPPAKPLWFT